MFRVLLTARCCVSASSPCGHAACTTATSSRVNIIEALRASLSVRIRARAGRDVQARDADGRRALPRVFAPVEYAALPVRTELRAAPRTPGSSPVDCGGEIADAGDMAKPGLLKKVDAVTVRVPDLDAGLAFYAGLLGHRLKWRNDAVGQAGIELPNGDSELVLTIEHGCEPNWLVDSVDHAVETFRNNGGTVVAEPVDIPVGRVGVVLDPFGNALVLVDLSRGTYVTDDDGLVTGTVQVVTD
jgi:predicted enzyme related to lactoylglutathione lyase